jgi:hypothetical protein
MVPNEAKGLYLSVLHRELSMHGEAHNSKTTIPPVWKSYVTTFRCGNFTPRLFDVVSHTALSTEACPTETAIMIR